MLDTSLNQRFHCIEFDKYSMRAIEFIPREQEAYEAGAFRKASGLEYKNPWHPEHQRAMHDACRNGYHEAEYDPELAALETIEEGGSPAWRSSGRKPKMKFRCTSGPRAGRVVSDLRQCGEHPDPAKAAKFRLTKAKKGARMARKSKRTKKVSPMSKIIAQLNKMRRKK